MIERKICQIIDRNPNLIKTLDHMPKLIKDILLLNIGVFNTKFLME